MEKTLDFKDPKTHEDPSEFYLALRESGCPVHRLPAVGSKPDVYVVTSYEHVQKLLTNPAVFSSRTAAFLLEGAGGNPDVDAILSKGLPPIAGINTLDGAEHKRLRFVLNACLSRDRIAKMEPMITDIVNQLIDDFIDDGTCDFIRQFAEPLPIFLVSDLLGIDRARHLDVKRWTDAILLFVGQAGTPDEEVSAAHNIIEMQNFLMNMIREKRMHRTDDLASDVIWTDMMGEPPLSDIEAFGVLRSVLIAGNESTRNTMMGGMAALLQYPDQLKALLDDPALMPKAIEEILRYVTPTASLPRITTCPFELAGVQMPENARVMPRFDSGNWDPQVFEDPRLFNIHRKMARGHMAFGFGIHNCVGQGLARRELTIAFTALLTRLKNIKIIAEKSDLRPKPSLAIRALRALHISFEKND